MFSFDIDSPSLRRRSSLRRSPSTNGSKPISRSNSERGGGSRKRGYNHVIVVSEDEEEKREVRGGDGDGMELREHTEVVRDDGGGDSKGTKKLPSQAIMLGQGQGIVQEPINLASESSISEQPANPIKRARKSDSFIEEAVLDERSGSVVNRGNEVGKDEDEVEIDKEVRNGNDDEAGNDNETNNDHECKENANQSAPHEDAPSLEDSLVIDVNKPSRSTPVTEFGSILLFDKALEDASRVSTYRCECQLVGHNQRVPLQSLYEEAPRIVGGGGI